ncbi:hypothetical protein PYW08_008494 [Mythimna loreyi]|uniref:Uncharacterized protein n=1 Tax=Mythimna loreyi TaxID=667449 RepID=A0ACC2QBL9_9NEOP|nr:hypothetical protein PYW08_008494 [Mythimna loreyi]
MAQSFCGILSIFDHNVNDWKTYKGRVTQWFIANNIDAKNDAAGTRRRAILLSALNDGTYKLAADLALPKDVQEVPYEELVTLLDNHFTPKRCGFSERHNFYAASQQPGETPTQWAARLRGLTAHCGFSNVEEALRDRFVMGMLAGPEREKLFALDTETLTLAKAVELAESIRCARAGAAATAPASTDQAQVFKIAKGQNSVNTTNSAEKKKCSVCGRANHESSQCRFAKYKCKKCNSVGHLRRMCNKVNYVLTGDVSEDDDGKLYNIFSARGEPMSETVMINGQNLKFQLDSGSAVTVISEGTYKKLFSGTPLHSSNKRFYSYTGTDMQCVGYVRLPITYMKRTHTLDVFVIRHGGPPLLGRDFISIFKLRLTPVNFLNDTQTAIDRLQTQFPEVFSDKLGAFKNYKVKLQLSNDAKPIFFKARPIAFALRDKVDKELERLVNLGVLKPVKHADYASPIVPVLKRDGSVRLCADYSVTINKQLVIEQYPIPSVHELFSKLHGGQQFSKIDLSMAYNQFLLDDESQDITCINTHRGLFKYTRLVFGLSSAPSIFQRAMESVLSGLDGVLCLLDDVLITASTKELHLEKLHIVLKRLQDAGLTVRKDKCEFFKDEIKYLGYIINRNGLKKDSSKVKAIVDAPVPSNIATLQSFLGLVNYYRNFVPRASSILSPLYDLLKKGAKWHWTAIHQNAFNEIKKCLTSEQVLTHFDPNSKIILTVDASPFGLGAVLSQVGSDMLERPISFASRTLTSAEKRYSQIQKEATAIIFGIKRYHQYLYGRSIPFTLRTDHKPLITIFGPYKGIPEVSANRLQRYAMFLSAYNYTIEYVKSADNNADYLSRASLRHDQQQTEERGDSGAHAAASAAPIDRATYVNFVVDGSIPVTLDELRKETAKDIILAKVINYIQYGWPRQLLTDSNIKPYYLCRTQLSHENGCVMRGHKVVIPGTLRSKILHELHNSHLGIVKTKAEARSRFWFPGVDAALEAMINSCDICQQLRPSPPRTPIMPWRYPPQPFYRIHIDFLGPLNNQMFFVVVDAYTKWVELYDVTMSTTSTNVIEKLYDFMSKYGLPHTIVSDNGTAFTSFEFRNFCLKNGIDHMTSPAYNPQSNGQAESYVKIVKKAIKSCITHSRNKSDCKIKILKYLFDYRNSVHSVTGFSPAELVFGRKLRSRLDLINPKPPSASFTSLTDNVYRQQCSQIKARGGCNKQVFKPGDPIMYKKFINNGTFRWCKGIIKKRLGKVLYLIQDLITSCDVKKHKNQIILLKDDKGNVSQQADAQHHYDLDDFNNSRSEPLPGEPPVQAPAGEGTDDADLQSPPSADTNTVSGPISRNPERLLRNIPRADYKPFL